MSKPKLLALTRERPLLQVALDFNNIASASSVALETYLGGAHIIEIGTPLVKSYGIYAVTVFRSMFKDRLVVVDTKTVDASRMELEIFLREGVDGVTVLGLAEDEVIKEALSICSEYNTVLIVDLIHLSSPIDRALRLSDLGVQVFVLHVGVDIQKRRGITAIQLLREVEELSKSNVIVAVAGGIKPENAHIFVQHGARIVIIGSAITRAKDPKKATELAIKNISEAKIFK